MIPLVSDIPTQSSVKIKQSNTEYNISTLFSFSDEPKNIYHNIWHLDDYVFAIKINPVETNLKLFNHFESVYSFSKSETGFYNDNYDIIAKFKPNKVFKKKARIRSVSKFTPKPII